jgi:hypothetical protein
MLGNLIAMYRRTNSADAEEVSVQRGHPWPSGDGCLRFSTCAAAGITSSVIALNPRHPIHPHDFSQFMLDDLLQRFDCWGSSNRSNIPYFPFSFRFKGKGCIMQGGVVGDHFAVRYSLGVLLPAPEKNPMNTTVDASKTSRKLG